MANKLTAQVYNNKGKEVSTLDLPENLFGLSWNADMMHQVITGMQSNQRSGTAHTKGRGEVSGGGKKPWRQKGTGRARHGSSRSPIWIGGGTTHGPLKDKSYDKKINKKTRQKALFVALSEKLRSGHLLFVDAITSSGKTKEVADALKGLSSVDGFKTLCTRKSNNILVLSGDLNPATKRAFKNISFATVDPAIGANALDVMKYRYVLVSNPDEALKAWSAKGVSRTVKAVEKKAAKKALKAEKAAQPKKEKTGKKGRAKKTEVKTS